MRTSILIGLIGTIAAPASVAFAAYLPSHAVICVDDKGNPSSIVSKEKLAKALLKTTDAWKLYIDVEEINPKYGPRWRAIFIDPDFCATDKACLAPPLDSASKEKLDNSAANATLDQLRGVLEESIRDGTTRDGLYRTANPRMGLKYLISGKYEDSIECIGKDPDPAPKPLVLKMPQGLRLRANSDDLNIPASDSAFKNVKPATVSYTADSVQGARVTKFQAALGYAIPLPLGDQLPKGLSYLDGELVPFISANESISKSNGKAATLADTNTVAVGALFNTVGAFDGWPGVTHVVSAKPQYVWNTKDRSEIASVTFVYQPWTAQGLKINTPMQIGNILGASWLTLLFDIRNDTGDYTNKGIDPVAALTHTSFDRAGSKFGFALATNDQGPHLVLNVTETLLYGFVGSIKRLDYFDSSLTYYFDSTSNFGFTLSYTKGTNEDTIQRAQVYMAGLSAKF